MWYIACFRRISLFLLLFCAMSGLTRAELIVLDFTDIAIPGGTNLDFFTPYTSQGFTLTANAVNGFSSGFEAHGPNSSFYAGEIGLAAFAPASSPDNVITLKQDNDQPFSILSIDLARNSAFDPAPTVNFTGTKSDGSTVPESFTVTVPVGTPAFQTFDFTGFTDLKSLSWGQPVLADGLHQFANIHLVTGQVAVPEPSTVFLMAIGTAMILGLHFRARRRGDGHERDRSSH